MAMVILGMFLVGVVEFNIVKYVSIRGFEPNAVRGRWPMYVSFLTFRRVVQGPDEIIEGMPIYHSNMVPPDLSRMKLVPYLLLFHFLCIFSVKKSKEYEKIEWNNEIIKFYTIVGFFSRGELAEIDALHICFRVYFLLLFFFRHVLS